MSPRIGKHTPRPPRRLARLLCLAWTTLLLTGCLLTRVYGFKDQFCDYEANFRLRVEGDVTLTMFHPILLDADVIWLLGAPPTRVEEQGDRLRMHYVIEKDLPEPDPDYDIPFDLRFVRAEDGRFKLARGRIHKDLATLLTPELITRAVENACAAHPSPFERSVEIDLGDVDTAGLPTREELLALLGTPSFHAAEGNEMAFAYRLKNAPSGSESALGRVHFDPSGKLSKLRLRYLRYEISADFVRKQAVIAIEL